MGFWDFAKKMVQGKPVFDTPSDTSTSSSAEPSADPNAEYKKELLPEEPGERSREKSRRYDGRGEKIMPRVEMSYCHCVMTTASMQVWATIRNNSLINVYLDKVTVCGATIPFNYPLAPGQQRDFMVYDGDKPSSSSECYSDVYYHDSGNGDNFVLQHMVAFRDDQDGTFSPIGFKPMMPRGVQHSIV